MCEVSGQFFPIATSIAEVVWDPSIGQFTMGEMQVSIAGSTGYVSGVFKLGLDPLYGPIVGMKVAARDVAIANEHGHAGRRRSPRSTSRAGRRRSMARRASTSSRPKRPTAASWCRPGRIDMVRRGTGFEMNIAGDGLSADDLKRLWPAFLATESRDWFVKNVVGGRIKKSTMRYDFPVGSLGEPGENKPMPKNAMSIDIVGTGVKIKALDTMDPITIEGEMRPEPQGHRHPDLG